MASQKVRPTLFLELLVFISAVDTYLAWLVTRKYPAFRYLIIQEDQLVENLSAVFFFIAFGLGIYFFLKLRRIQSRPLLIGIALVGLNGFLDEISFGERIFHFTPPVIGGVQFDAVHDIVEIIYKNVPFTPGLLAVIGVFVTVPVIWLLMRLFKGGWDRAVEKVVRCFSTPTPYFMLLFVFFLGTAIVFDLDALPVSHWYRRLFFSLEEVFEMNAAFDLCLFSFSLYQSSIQGKRATAARANSFGEAQPAPQPSEAIARDLGSTAPACFPVPVKDQNRKVEEDG